MQLLKSSTGIQGLDELTGGGLPQGRATLVCGGPGCGKTLLSMEFLVHGALRYGEPGVFMAFEESPRDLTENVASLGFDLEALVAKDLLSIDRVQVNRSELEESGEYDLEGLFIRLGHAIDRIGAKRVVLDTIETLFGGLADQAVLRSELRRLFQWLKDKGVTAIITGERGNDPAMLTRQGLEEYVSDCVIVLDHRVSGMVSSRRLRVVKYRGSTHGTNEYPFLIDGDGITVLPVTSLGLAHVASNERVSSGIASLDAMLEGKGYFKGTSILLGGAAGAGKTSIAAHFADSACRRGERCVYFAFEESPSQLTRNMGSVGMNLKSWSDKGLLRFRAERPSLHGFEPHLALMFKELLDFKPDVAVVDPLSALLSIGTTQQTQGMLLRLIDHLKTLGVTALYTTLQVEENQSGVDVSSIMDTWIRLESSQDENDLVRRLHIVKSRGMAHATDLRRMLITPAGVQLAKTP